MTRTVLVAGGGSTRHLAVGLAVAQELKALGVDVHWLGDRAAVETVALRDLRGTRLEVAEPPPWSPAQALGAIAKLPVAVATVSRLLYRLEPLAVVAAGGLVSFVALLAAGLAGVPAVVHEQSVLPGWGGRLTAPWSDLICCGFAESLSYFRSLPAEWTFNPVRAELFAVPPPPLGEPRRLLVLGGSRGSLLLNRTLPRAVGMLRSRGLAVEVTHQAGAAWTDTVRAAYRDLGLTAEVVPFLAEPWRVLAGCDLVVSRAGGLTVSELLAAGRSSLLIPYAEGADSQQEYNARAVERAGAAVVINQRDANAARTAAALAELLEDRPRLLEMAARARANTLPDAGRRIAERVLAVGGPQ